MRFAMQITTGSTTPIYRQIINQACRAMAAGELSEGDRLPSVRALAARILVNPNTVSRAYGELIRDGLVVSRPGKGCFVAERRRIYSAAERKRRLDEALQPLMDAALVLNCTPAELRRALDRHLENTKSPSPIEEQP